MDNFVGALLSLNLSVGCEVGVWKILLSGLYVWVLGRTMMSVHKRGSDGPATTAQLHMVECHLLHPLKPVNLIPLLHLQLPEIPIRRQLLPLRMIQRFVLRPCIRAPLVRRLKQILPLLACIPWWLFTLRIDAFDRGWVLRRTGLLNLLNLAFVNKRVVEVLLHRLLVLLLQVVLSDRRGDLLL